MTWKLHQILVSSPVYSQWCCSSTSLTRFASYHVLLRDTDNALQSFFFFFSIQMLSHHSNLFQLVPPRSTSRYCSLQIAKSNFSDADKTFIINYYLDYHLLVWNLINTSFSAFSPSQRWKWMTFTHWLLILEFIKGKGVGVLFAWAVKMPPGSTFDDVSWLRDSLQK